MEIIATLLRFPSLTILVSVAIPEPQHSDFRHKGVLPLEGVVGGGQRVHERKIGRLGSPRHVGVASGVHRDAIACVKAAAAQVRGVGQGERGGSIVKAQLADEGVIESLKDAVGGQRVRERKIGRIGSPCDVGVASGIHRDAIAFVNEAAAAQVSGIGQGERGGPVVKTQLADEGVLEPSEGVVGGGQRVRGGKIGRSGEPRHVGVASGIHRDAQAPVKAAAAQVGGVDQGERWRS